MPAVGKKHRFVWDGRGERGEDARLSIMAGRTATDQRLKLVHFRILAHLGRFNHKKGWCKLNQAELAKMFGINRRTVNGAVSQLVDWQYLEKQSQKEAGESFCLYRVVIDRPDEDGAASGSGDAGPSEGEIPTSHSPDTTQKAGVSGTDLTPPEAGVRSPDLTSEIPAATRVRSQTSHPPQGAYRERARIDHVDTIDKKKSAGFVENQGIDGGYGERLPFTADALREIASHGVDVLELIEQFAAKTKGKRIKDPNAYLLKMGRQAAAKLHGVTAETIKAIATRDRGVRATELAAAVGVSAEPSVAMLRAAVRWAARMGESHDAVLRDWRRSVAHQRLTTTQRADQSLETFLSHRRFAKQAVALRRAQPVSMMRAHA
jgi:hypothetical protein